MESYRSITAYLAADAYATAHPPAPAQPAATATPSTALEASPSATDVIERPHASTWLADLGAGSSFLAGALGAGAGVAAGMGRDDIAIGFAAAAGVAGAVGGIGEFIDHLRERGKDEVASPALNDTAAATGAIAGAFGAGAGVLAMVPGYEHAAIGMGILAGVSGAVDGVVDIIDHRKNEQGFSGGSPITRDVDSATNGIAGALNAVANMAPAVPGGAALAGVAAGIQGVAHIVHHLMHRHDDEPTSEGGSAHEAAFEKAAAAAHLSAGAKQKTEVVG